MITTFYTVSTKLGLLISFVEYYQLSAIFYKISIYINTVYFLSVGVYINLLIELAINIIYIILRKEKKKYFIERVKANTRSH